MNIATAKANLSFMTNKIKGEKTDIKQIRRCEIESLEFAISALEKQIPKQPTLYGNCEDGKLVCPNCNEDLWDLKECGFDFCPYCSQAIKFGGI